MQRSEGPLPTHNIKLRVRAGMPPGHGSLVPNIGCYGLNAKRLADDVAMATKPWKGQKVDCVVVVRDRSVHVSVAPSIAARILKCLRAPGRPCGDRVMTFTEVLAIVRDAAPCSNSLAKDFQAAVLECLGTAASIGCLVDGVHPKMIQAKIKAGLIVVPNE